MLRLRIARSRSAMAPIPPVLLVVPSLMMFCLGKPLAVAHLSKYLYFSAFFRRKKKKKKEGGNGGGSKMR